MDAYRPRTRLLIKPVIPEDKHNYKHYQPQARVAHFYEQTFSLIRDFARRLSLTNQTASGQFQGVLERAAAGGIMLPPEHIDDSDDDNEEDHAFDAQPTSHFECVDQSAQPLPESQHFSRHSPPMHTQPTQPSQVDDMSGIHMGLNMEYTRPIVSSGENQTMLPPFSYDPKVDMIPEIQDAMDMDPFPFRVTRHCSLHQT